MSKLDPRNPIHLLACGFGSGLAPKAPGTFGTLAAFPLWYLLQMLSWPQYWVVVVAAFALGVFVCGRTAGDMGVHDHGALVWDEFVGLWVALACVPLDWFWIVLGFILFRVFDIWKPWPIRWFDRNLKGGLGVMTDDVVAGLLVLIILALLKAI
ncbi:MAG: phosphatidylglycerophosphatase A [Spongiibacteraceae bacterium]